MVNLLLSKERKHAGLRHHNICVGEQKFLQKENPPKAML